MFSGVLSVPANIKTFVKVDKISVLGKITSILSEIKGFYTIVTVIIPTIYWLAEQPRFKLTVVRAFG